MAVGEAVKLAIGVGCRRSCPAEAIVALVGQACEGLETGDACLFTIEAKRDEAGLVDAAAMLGFPLMFLSVAQLDAAIPSVLTRSTTVERAMGVASVAEAAALAGAGAGSRLIVPRLAAAGATCAVAIGSPAASR